MKNVLLSRAARTTRETIIQKTSSYLDERLDQRDKHERQLSTEAIGFEPVTHPLIRDTNEDEKLGTIFSLKSRREWIVLIFPRLGVTSRNALLRQNF